MKKLSILIAGILIAACGIKKGSTTIEVPIESAEYTPNASTENIQKVDKLYQDHLPCYNEWYSNLDIKTTLLCY